MPEPFFIAGPARQLYAVYYPAVGSPRSQNVVFCPAFGQENVRLYRAIHDSSNRLAASGFNVLRFDYSGCGNSSEPAQELSLDLWQEDLALAIAEVSDISGCKSTACVAIRMGALVAQSQPDPAAKLALLDPVVDGAAYVDNLASLHKQMCENKLKYMDPEGNFALTDNELAGHSVSDRLLDQLRSARLDIKADQDCFAVFSNNNLFDAYRHHTQTDLCETVPFECQWDSANVLEEMLNPQACLKRLERYLTDV